MANVLISNGIEGDVAALARRQHQLVTRTQLLDLGVSSSSIQRRRRSDRLIDVAPGVYLINGASFTWATKVHAICLATSGVASHRTAAAMLDVSGFPQGRVEVSVPHGHRSLAIDAIQRERTDFGVIVPTMIDGIPTTDACRLVADLGAVVNHERYAAAVLDLVGRRVLTWDDIMRSRFRHSRRGRDGCGALSRLLEERFGEAVPDSHLERAFYLLLEEAGLAHHLVQQLEIFDTEGFVARVDFGNERKRVAIELDSVKFHLTLEAFESDPRKRNRLAAAGWTVLAFTWKALITEPHRVIVQVRAALGLPI